MGHTALAIGCLDAGGRVEEGWRGVLNLTGVNTRPVNLLAGFSGRSDLKSKIISLVRESTIFNIK
jgi:hypothetical protein